MPTGSPVAAAGHRPGAGPARPPAALPRATSDHAGCALAGQ